MTGDLEERTKLENGKGVYHRFLPKSAQVVEETGNSCDTEYERVRNALKRKGRDSVENSGNETGNARTLMAGTPEYTPWGVRVRDAEKGLSRRIGRKWR